MNGYLILKVCDVI